MDLEKFYTECRLCPRECGVDRTKGQLGYCREAHRPRVAYLGPHFGEEPPLTGTCGSGTLFFTGCSLRCSYCQNYQISREGFGETAEVETLLQGVIDMMDRNSVHNLNLVTPDHFFPHAFALVDLLRRAGYDLPVVYNLSGYQAVPMLKVAEEFADIYLPDFKYSDSGLSSRLSGCRDYPEKALDAVAEMVRQKGFLDPLEEGAPTATRGVLVRHLILPGQVQNSLDVLTTLLLEFGAGLPLSLMSQYTPVLAQREEDLNRFVTGDEFDRVYRHALELGFEHLFVQFPEPGGRVGNRESSFLPDFRLARPFSGGASKG
ncbi:MAG: radical SAM protein [Deltaproteobacteria bacterium]|nr:radical SAM protein [Deltaproteobacteria bacterium]